MASLCRCCRQGSQSKSILYPPKSYPPLTHLHAYPDQVEMHPRVTVNSLHPPLLPPPRPLALHLHYHYILFLLTLPLPPPSLSPGLPPSSSHPPPSPPPHPPLFPLPPLPPPCEVDEDEVNPCPPCYTLHPLLASVTAGEDANRALMSCKFQ